MRMNAAALDVLPVSRLCKALGDETRLRIVALLSHGELCVCHVEDALGLTQPNASRQLAVLKQAGVVTGRREGNWVLYKLAPQKDADCEAMLRLLVGGFARREVLRRDVERLLQAKGPKPCT